MRRWFILIALLPGLVACGNTFFFPYRGHIQTPKQLGLAYEDVYFNASDGTRLHGWFLPSQGQAQGTILFLHGNAENISTHIMSVHWLPARGFNVFLLDYRGYGASEGKPSFAGVQQDVESALRMLVFRPEIDDNRIVIFGQSLGGSIALYHAAHTSYRRHVRAVVTESAFAGYRQIAEEKLADFWLTWAFQWPLSFAVSDKYSASKAVGKISPIPLLIIHGDQDRIVPVEHGKQLFELAQAPKQLWIIAGGGHIEAFRNLNNRDRFVDYLSRVPGLEPSKN